MGGDVVWLDVLPALATFGKNLIDGTKKAGAEAGKSTGDAWSAEFGKAAGDGGSGKVVAELEANEKKAKASVQDSTKAIGQARAAQHDATARVVLAEENYRKAVEKSGEDSAQAQAAALKLESAREKQKLAADRTEGAEISLKAAIDEQKSASEELAKAQSEVTEETEKGGDAAEGAEKKWSNFNVSWGAIAAGAAAVVAGVAATGKALYDVGATFDDVEDTIRVGTGATGEALDGMVEVARNVGSTVPVEFDKIGPAVADLNTRLGLTGSTLETVASQVLAAGEMLGEDVDINGVTGAFSAFQLQADQIPGSLDHVFRVSQATGIGFNDLTKTIEAQAPALQALGFGFEDTANMIGLLDRAGINADAVMAGMSKGLVTLAKDGEEPVEAFDRIVGEIGSFIDAGDKAAALDLASQVFGTRGATQFVGAIESGALALDAMSASGLMSGDTILGLADDTYDFAEQWQLFKNNVLIAIEPIAARVFGAIGDAMAWLKDEGVPVVQEFAGWLEEHVGPAFEAIATWITADALPALQDFGGWVVQNKDWLLAIGVAVGTIAVAWGTYTLAMTAATAATSAWSAVVKAGQAIQAAFNAVMAMNPIGLVITAVAALAAGLTYFFTQTDTGRAIWQGFTDFLGSAWENVSSGLVSAWEWVQSAFQTGWEFIDKNVFEPVKQGAQWVWDKVVAVKDGAVGAWNLLRDGFKAGWEFIDKNVFEPVKQGAQWVWDKVVAVKDGAVGAWNLLKDGFKAGWDFIDQSVFGPLKAGVDAVRAAFDTAVDLIGAAWDKIKSAAARPVNFIIETVYTNGIKATFDKIAGAVGLSLSLPTVSPIKLASGGVMPGWSPGRDIHQFFSPTGGRLDLSGGEAVMRPEFTRAVGGPDGVAALNRAAVAGRLPSQAFAGGGVVGWLGNAVAGVGDFVSGIANGIKDAVINVAAFLADPARGFATLLTAPMETLLKTVMAGDLGDALVEYPRKAVESLIEKALGLIANLGGGDGEDGPVPDAGGWSRPSYGPITSRFGPRWGAFHNGIDIAGGGRTYAIWNGRVKKVGWNVGYGNTGIGILLGHSNGLESYYGHNPVGGVRVSPGDLVNSGQWIGMQGATGNVTGIHLHHSIFSGGKALDPIRFGKYDTGGALLPGLTLAYNGTGQAETIRTAEQEAALFNPAPSVVDLSDASLDALADRLDRHAQTRARQAAVGRPVVGTRGGR